VLRARAAQSATHYIRPEVRDVASAIFSAPRRSIPMTDPQPPTPAAGSKSPATTPAAEAEPRTQPVQGTHRTANSKVVAWLLAVVAVGALGSAGLLVLQLNRDIQSEDAARARVDWLAQEHDASVDRWNVAFERADDLRQRCVRGEDVGFEWVTQLGVALAHAERALEAGNAAVEGAHATGQTELADRLSRTVSDNRESWAAERTRHSLLISSPLALNCG
jgi:hypothetical protein